MKFVVNNKVMNTGVADANGVQWYVTGWDGWDSPDVRQNFLDPVSKHGQVSSNGLYGSRSIVLNGVVKAPDITTFWNAYYELQSLTSSLNVPFDLVVTELVDKRVSVVRAGRVKQTIKGNFAFEYEVPLIANDPVKYGVVPQSSVIAAGSTVTLFNGGSFDSSPVFTVTSSGIVWLENNTITPQRFKTLVSVDVDAVIDAGAMTLYEGSTNSYAKIDPACVWWDLAPGNNTVTNNGSASVSVQFYPTWI